MEGEIGLAEKAVILREAPSNAEREDAESYVFWLAAGDRIPNPPPGAT